MKKKKLIVLIVLVLNALSYAACSNIGTDEGTIKSSIVNVVENITDGVKDFLDKDKNETSEYSDETINEFDYSLIPAYESTAAVEVNNSPFFSEEEITYAKNNVFENYSELDSLGRCGITYANVCKELMPTEERGKIGMIKPSGWHNAKYAGIDGNYIYNRCHLIGFQLAGENANEKNLITGTRYMNTEGMLPYENMIAEYVHNTNNHVLYRVTPIFVDTELVARGVLMEAYSIEDSGAGIQFCVFAYNVQPGCEIDYVTGYTSGPEFTGSGL